MYYNEARYNILTETGPEPISIDDVKFQLNMRFDTTTDYDFNDDDTFIAMLISNCREAVERFCEISIIEKSIEAELRNECGNIVLPGAPVDEITAIVDADGDAVTQYTVKGGKYPYIVSPMYDYLKVTYSAGYPAVGLQVPKSLKQAIVEEVVWRYSNRGESNDAGIQSEQARKLLSQFKLKSWLV